MTLPPILNIDYKFDDNKLKEVFEKYNNQYGPFDVEKDNWADEHPVDRIIPNCRIIFSDGYQDPELIEIAAEFCKHYGIDYKFHVIFLCIEANSTLPWHKDMNGSVTCINHIISDNPSSISFKTGDYFYKTALIDIQRTHQVVNKENERIVFRITFTDPEATYEQLYNLINKKNIT